MYTILIIIIMHNYVIEHSVDKLYIKFAELTDHSVLHAHKKNNIIYVYLKHYF